MSHVKKKKRKGKKREREREEEQLFKLNHDAFQFQQRCNSAGGEERGGRIALIRCKSLKHAPRIDDARISLTSVTNSQPARLFTEKQAGRMKRVFKRERFEEWKRPWRVSLARTASRPSTLFSSFFLSFSLFFFLNFSRQNSRNRVFPRHLRRRKEEEREINVRTRKSYPILFQDHKEGVVFF